MEEHIKSPEYVPSGFLVRVLYKIQKKVIIQPLYLYRFPCFRLNILITISDKPQNIPPKRESAPRISKRK